MVLAGVAVMVFGWLLLGKIGYEPHKNTGETHLGGYWAVKAYWDEYRHLFPQSYLPELSITCMVDGFALLVLRFFSSPPRAETLRKSQKRTLLHVSAVAS